MSDRVLIFDTTLRDGEQCPGASMNLRQKLEVARQLAKLGVDVIEAGFPVISEGDFEAVQRIAGEIGDGADDPVICGLARCVPKDIDAAGRALAGRAEGKSRIHVFLATSKIHLEHKFKKAQDEILRLAVEGVKQARSFTTNVEFSPEDASRTEPEFLIEVCKAVIAAGATTLNIPDTVGWAVPGEYGALIGQLYAAVPEFQTGAARISVHCHNDLGLAVANSLAAVMAGARQIECTINGIGERAGNAALEEVVMALKTRSDFYTGVGTRITTEEIVRTSKLVSRASSFVVQRNKAIVGENAFAHSSGIHQDGILKKRETYEIMDPKEVGWASTELPLTKHSGRNALISRLQKLGHDLTSEEVDKVFVGFKKIGDMKKFVYDEDLDSLVEDLGTHGKTSSLHKPEWSLVDVHYAKLGETTSTAHVSLKKASTGEIVKAESAGDGSVDAALKCVSELTGLHGDLESYTVTAISQGKDAQGQCAIKVSFDGSVEHSRGVDPDVIVASIKAYLAAINRHLTKMAVPASEALPQP